MIVRTKKFQMEKGQYIRKGFFNLLSEQWWILLIYIVLCRVMSCRTSHNMLCNTFETCSQHIRNMLATCS